MPLIITEHNGIIRSPPHWTHISLLIKPKFTKCRFRPSKSILVPLVLKKTTNWSSVESCSHLQLLRRAAVSVMMTGAESSAVEKTAAIQEVCCRGTVGVQIHGEFTHFSRRNELNLKGPIEWLFSCSLALGRHISSIIPHSNNLAISVAFFSSGQHSALSSKATYCNYTLLIGKLVRPLSNDYCFFACQFWRLKDWENALWSQCDCVLLALSQITF